MIGVLAGAGAGVAVRAVATGGVASARRWPGRGSPSSWVGRVTDTRWGVTVAVLTTVVAAVSTLAVAR